MQEIELKFQIPPRHADAVRQSVAHKAGKIEPLALQAGYFDTADSRLASHKMALRVRREGADWVQTFKAAGQDAMTRVEDNQDAKPPLDGRLRPDLALHTSAKVRQALALALGLDELGAASADELGLSAVYETRFERWSRQEAHPQGQVIVCVDIGEVMAGSLREPLNELEIELVQGQAQAVIDTARQWVDGHGVWLDVQSKAYRGTRLAQAERHGQPVSARPVPHGLSPWLERTDFDPRRILSATLDAAAGNWSEVAAARPGWPEALATWQATLSSLLALAERHAALKDALPEAAWHTTRDILSDLDRLHRPGTPDAPPGEAQALATAPRTTHWGLDLLTAIRR